MYTVNSIRALTLLLMISFIGFCQHVLGLQKALLAYNARTNARTVVGPSKLLKYPAAETTDLLHVDGQHIETMYNHTPTHKHTHPHTHTHTQTHTSTHTHILTHTHIQTHTHKHKHTHRTNDATLLAGAKLLRQHICAGVLHLGIKCKFVLEYQVCVFTCICRIYVYTYASVY